MIFAHSTSAPSHGSTLRIRDVVKRYAVSETTIRRATANGSLSCLTLPSGHRRFLESDVLAWLGKSKAEEECAVDGIAAVIRVSSDGQSRPQNGSDKSSLQHQEERVRTFIAKRFGPSVNVTWYRSIGSGLNFNRKELLALIQDLLAGKYRGGFVVAQDFTRVARFGHQLIEYIAKQGGAEVVYVLQDEDKTANESLTDDILSILTHFTAKCSGLKTKEFRTVRLSESQLKKAYELSKAGHSHKSIATMFRASGETDSQERPFSYHVIRRRLNEHWQTLEKLHDSNGRRESSFDVFASKHLRKVESTDARVSHRSIVAAYRAFCNKGKLPVVTERRIAATVKKLGWIKSYGRNGLTYVGLSLWIDRTERKGSNVEDRT